VKHGVDGKVKKKVLASTLAKIRNAVKGRPTRIRAGGPHLDFEMWETIWGTQSYWQNLASRQNAAKSVA
jgi:hypothetical protein